MTEITRTHTRTCHLVGSQSVALLNGQSFIVCCLRFRMAFLLVLLYLFIVIFANCCIALAMNDTSSQLHSLSAEVVIFPATGSFGTQSPVLGDLMPQGCRVEHTHFLSYAGKITVLLPRWTCTTFIVAARLCSFFPLFYCCCGTECHATRQPYATYFHWTKCTFSIIFIFTLLLRLLAFNCLWHFTQRPSPPLPCTDVISCCHHPPAC